MALSIKSILGGSLWKAATIVAFLASLVVGYFLIQSGFENKQITKERDRLALTITDPKTGYIARLTQANANVVILQKAIETQNIAFTKQSEASKVELRRLTKELALAQAKSREAERRLAEFMSRKPQGATLQDRITDIDNRVLKDLKR
jgi:hypothetical protein